MKKWILATLMILSSSFAHAGGWSAIAYDTNTGKYGYAYGTYNQQQAESNAIASCNSLNCRVVGTAFNRWLSLALSNTDVKMYGVGWSPNQYESLYWSMYYCNQGTYSCKVVVNIYAHD
ncbi:MAG: DUF4189 domain-containing protein [Bdellovibrio sp.]